MSAKSKANSPEEFWNNVEQIYGEIPKIIRLVLQLNGFDSYLALKGIRNEDLKDFFQSLEVTVHETMASDFNSDERVEIEEEILANYQSPLKFKLRPGHRNYILNLMKEIERMDANEFFRRFPTSEVVEMEMAVVKPELVRPPIKTEQSEYIVTHINIPDTSGNIIVRKSSDDKHQQVVLNQDDHGYSRDDQEIVEEEEDFMVEEEYLTDETMDSLIRIEYDTVVENVSAQNISDRQQLNKKRTRSKPAHMYNDEFISKAINPRRRRVTINKIYAPTDEGTRERFRDLVVQSMNCILPREKLVEVENADVHVEKETDTSWAVYCPLCHSRIRLPVVHENNGRYCNYKRSNFERHLRFKHCKTPKTGTLEATELLFEEIVD